MNDLTRYSDEELKAIHNNLTQQKGQFISVKKKTPVIPNKLALEVTTDEYQKQFEDLVKQIIK